MQNTVADLEETRKNEKKDSVVELLSSLDQAKLQKSSKPLHFIMDQQIQTSNLKEKFLCATFEIISELGSDAFSANELIKRTKSSKGALFHHFDTLDDLCIESLRFFHRQILQHGLKVDTCESLEEYVYYLAADLMGKQGSKQFVHLMNFYRDRAIRDERYQEPLKQLCEAMIGLLANRTAQFLPVGIRQEDLMKKVTFLYIVVERVGLQRVLYHNQDALEMEIKEFIEETIRQLKKLKPSAST